MHLHEEHVHECIFCRANLYRRAYRMRHRIRHRARGFRGARDRAQQLFRVSLGPESRMRWFSRCIQRRKLLRRARKGLLGRGQREWIASLYRVRRAVRLARMKARRAAVRAAQHAALVAQEKRIRALLRPVLLDRRRKNRSGRTDHRLALPVSALAAAHAGPSVCKVARVPRGRRTWRTVRTPSGPPVVLH